MQLTDQDKQMLNGEAGEAVRLAMAILVDLGQAIGAYEMVEIEHVHTDSGFYLGDAGLEFVEHLAALGGKVRVPTSMNNTTFDIERCRSYGVPSELAYKIKRIEKAHLSMGATPAWTCAPYQDGILPKLGSMVAWSESNAIVFANSVLGARTNRTGDLVDICCALTGRVPRSGYYLDENRLAGIQVQCEGMPAETFSDARFYPLLGYFIGKQCGHSVVAISGLPTNIGMDNLKGLGAAAASSGATALFHVVGVTPEAKSLQACLKIDTNIEVLTLSPDDLRQTWELLWSAENDRLDWIGFGCPHFSRDEFKELAACISGRKVRSDIAATIFTSRKVLHWLQMVGLYEKLTKTGFQIYTDGCLLLYPKFLKHSGTMMTNSAKAANYIYSQSGFQAAYGSIRECVESAMAGKIIQECPAWIRS